MNNFFGRHATKTKRPKTASKTQLKTQRRCWCQSDHTPQCLRTPQRGGEAAVRNRKFKQCLRTPLDYTTNEGQFKQWLRTPPESAKDLSCQRTLSHLYRWITSLDNMPRRQKGQRQRQRLNSKDKDAAGVKATKHSAMSKDTTERVKRLFEIERSSNVWGHHLTMQLTRGSSSNV